MTIIEAAGSVLGQYAGFRGRARRSEFWWWQVVALLLGLVVATVEVSLGIAGEDGGPVSTVVGLALLLPNVAVCVRRLHDSSRTGWWLLLALVPFLGLAVLLWFFVADSAPGPNRYGPSPKMTAAGGPWHDLAGPTTGPAPGDHRLPADGSPAGGPGWVPPGWDLPSPDGPSGRPTPSDADGDTRPDRPQG